MQSELLDIGGNYMFASRRSSLSDSEMSRRNDSKAGVKGVHILLILIVANSLWVIVASISLMNGNFYNLGGGTIGPICYGDLPTTGEQADELPQNLCFGPYYNGKDATDLERGRPFVTQDCWADIVDNERTFYLRPEEEGMLSMEELATWLRSKTHPVALVMNNQVAKSWRADLNNDDYELLLDKPNLHAIYTLNPRKLPVHTANHAKLKPLPNGMKWNWHSTQLFGEPKESLTQLYSQNVATTLAQAGDLFRSKTRTNTIFFLRMTSSNSGTDNYARDTPAVRADRTSILPILQSSLDTNAIKIYGALNQTQYFAQLRQHRFFLSPAGNGLDSPSTWEGLLAGCIPILPHSLLDPLFDDLPVWLIDSWVGV